MSDWQIGDLAVCVDDECAPNLRKGATYTVAAYFRDPGINAKGGYSEYSLHLQEVKAPYGWGFCETRFRKIRHDTHEACEDEFVTLLKRQKVSA